MIDSTLKDAMILNVVDKVIILPNIEPKELWSLAAT